MLASRKSGGVEDGNDAVWGHSGWSKIVRSFYLSETFSF